VDVGLYDHHRRGSKHDTSQIVDLAEVERLEAVELPVLDPDDAAYVFFTSGTTGVPKGVLGCHKGLAHFLNWQRQTFAVEPQDRSAQLTGLSFDAVLRDIFLPLTSGATLCLPVESDDLGPAQILPWLEREQISLLHTVPSLAQSWLANVPPGVSLRALRQVFSVGEPLTETLVHQWREAFPEAGEIVNIYGPTETTLTKCYYRVPADDILPGVQPVGWPLPDTQSLVLTKSDQLCGISEPGEIVIRTPFRTLGYINMPEENERWFVQNPFRNDAQDCPDGSLEFLGRLDDQVKIRGVRIEPQEISAVLNQHPAVQQAVVSIWEFETGDKRLVAYVVPDRVQFPGVSDLRGFLQKRLPDYMIPANFVLIDAVPLTPNGKIDRRALPEPEMRPELAATFVAPQTQLEELVASAWTAVLGLEQIGIHENFFEIGGHSLLATQVMSRIRQAVQVDLPLRTLFEGPTVSALAKQIEVVRQAEPRFHVPPIRSSPRNGPLPLSFSQERIWFLHQLFPKSAAYNMPSGIRIKGPLNKAALEQSFNAMVRRHEILRTTFDIVDGRPAQIIASDGSVKLPVIDLRPLSTQARENRISELLTNQAKEPFDLVNGPLLRTALLQLDEEEHILFIAAHHIISDQWSYGVFGHELMAFYETFSSENSALLLDLPIQYADFAQWQRQWLQGDVLEAQLTYWMQQLADIPVLDLPTDRPRPAIQTFSGAHQILSLSPALIEAVRVLCRQEQVTPFMFLLTIFKTLLFRYTDQADIAVGTPIANRNRLEIEGLLGTFVNTLVFRTDLSGNPRFRELLGRVREAALDIFAHQDFPFEKLVEELQPERDMSHGPLVQVLFNVQNVPFTLPEHDDLTLSPVRIGRIPAQFDLTLSVNTELDPHMLLRYNPDLFDGATIRRMSSHLQTLLEAIIADPNQRLLDLPLLTQEERQQLLIEWNDTELGYAHATCLHQLFEAQVERSPEAIAVVFEEVRLTYRELNERANQLAHYLQNLGVGPEVRVGICLQRSLDMVIGLLGILKAGGAYLPLDPAFPLDRLSYMMADAQAPVLLTQIELVLAQPLVEDLPAPLPHIVSLDKDWATIEITAGPGGKSNLSSHVTPDNLAYVIYTSGSTGKPKGVQLSHRSVVNFLTAMSQQPGLTRQDILLSVTTLSFDISVLEFFLPLIVGAQVIVVADETAYDGFRLAAELADSGATVMQATPATWRMLKESGWQGDSNLKVLCGGEALPRDLADWLVEHVGSLWNMYGPTETTVWSTMTHIEPTTSLITVGRPIANTQTYILDEQFQPTPVGIVGELYIGGDGVARGYLNRPRLTAEKFIPDPFSSQSGARLYRTGDRARYLPGGDIEFLGRKDHQVKLRGFRIELGEIEAVLNQHPAAQAVVVIVREDFPGDKRLVAYIVPQQDQLFTTSELREFLLQKLPDYMVPSAFVVLETLPLTPNKKVDRNALQAPDQSRPKLEEAFVAPRTDVEKVIAEIMADVLNIEQVGVFDSFFELGGHSLLSIQLISRLNESLFVDVPLIGFFRMPTVVGLATALLQEPQMRMRVERTAQVLLQVSRLSDQQVKEMLQEKGGSKSG
jgi:amino acid adenylation domain-containing protein